MAKAIAHLSPAILQSKSPAAPAPRDGLHQDPTAHLIAAASDHDDRVISQEWSIEMSYDTAADAILALINSKPRSPTKDELTAVIAEVIAKAPTPQGAARDTYVASEWYRTLDQHLEASSRATTDKEHYALDARLGSAAKAICAKRVCTLDDLVVRAAIAVHLWHGADMLSSPADSGEHALAAVVRGVFALAGLKFDEVGRLL
jgi:hypothetical protein